jgi:ABC-type oligopeptide transport system substrate-binding subunit
VNYVSKNLWLSFVAVAIGACLSVAAGFAGSAQSATGSTARTGGTLNVDLFSDVDFTDPALDYLSTGWEIEYSTCLKLMNYPDVNGPQSSQLVPEAAAGFPRVSGNGRTYDFNVQAGFTKFSNGQRVTAGTFKYAIERLANPKMESPAAAFIGDIAGVQARLDGKAASVSGLRVKGSHLFVTLTKPAPDFLARVAMPFFCAVPTGLAIDPNGVETPAAAGPYYIASRTPGKSIVLKRNPNYQGKRPHNVGQIVYTIGNSLEATRLRVESGASDYAAGGIPPSAYAEVAKKYGINKGQFWVKPILGVAYLALNNDRPIFKGNLALKRAVNFAIDRKAMLTQNGYLAGKRTDQILPPGMAGFRDVDLYPLKGPNFKFAKKLANGKTRDGKIVYYTSNSAVSTAVAQILQFDLKQIGLEVEVKQFARAVQVQKSGTSGEPFDISSESWVADYADPFDFIDVLLNGKNIHASNNSNVSYFNDASFNAKMESASRLSGSARYAAYGDLDVEMMRSAAPWAPRSNFNSRTLLSKRVGCFTYNAIYGTDLAAACLK